MLINYNVPLTKSRQNAWIKANILTDEEMEKAGFRTTYDGKYWVFLKKLQHERIGGYDFDTTLDIVIDRETKKLQIDIIDEMWGQHYDYQAILRIDPEHPCALDIHNKVQEEMKKLLNSGIIIGYRLGDYI